MRASAQTHCTATQAHRPASFLTRLRKLKMMPYTSFDSSSNARPDFASFWSVSGWTAASGLGLDASATTTPPELRSHGGSCDCRRSDDALRDERRLVDGAVGVVADAEEGGGGLGSG